MLGKLYAHVSDPSRLLLIRRDLVFPYGQLTRQNWRVVAVGVEPADTWQARALQTKGFCEYRLPIVDDASIAAGQDAQKLA